jgi:hypothetical protein
LCYVTAWPPQQRLRLEQARERLERKILQTKNQRLEAEDRRRLLDLRIQKEQITTHLAFSKTS